MAESWLKKFYPVPADGAFALSDLECAKASLLKWQGLLSDNLNEFNARRSGLRSIVTIEGSLAIHSGTCHLCVKFEDECDDCPFTKANGVACSDGWSAPYNVYTNGGSPEPMIEALEKTVAFLEAQDEL